MSERLDAYTATGENKATGLAPNGLVPGGGRVWAGE
jgi:hypothetical protein